MGLVAREIESGGVPTLILANMPDLTEAVGVSRLVGVEYPHGRTLGQPGDAEGQLEVLRATFGAVGKMKASGTVVHLPFRWPEPRGKAISHPPTPPPIASHLVRRPWELGKFMAREPPG